MATSPNASFYALWQDDTIREKLFEHLPKSDICSLRLANSACCNLVTKRLFLRTHLTFTANTFTKPSRIQALSRIGHHIQHLTFTFSHSDATFLPPLIHPNSGREISYLYQPYTTMTSTLTRPKYTVNTELGEILTQQYPPLFHAATNVPSFIYAFKHLPSIRHITVKTPSQPLSERYRRSSVDYALISLRIAIERSALPKLTKLSLSGVHPASFVYLRPSPGGFGCSPSALKRWRQIRKLNISVDSWDFYGPSPGLDHLKIMDDYIRVFAPQLEKFSFTWLGRRGPCPLALAGDPLFAPPRHTKKLFNEVTSPMSPLPVAPLRQPMVMARLRCMAVRNATMNAPQLRGLIVGHKETVREFDFDNVALIKGGSWDEALAPLEKGREGSVGESSGWSRYSLSGSEGSLSRPGTAGSSVEDVGASAAAKAASKELFDVDLDGMVFGGVNDVERLEAGVEEWARGVTAAAASEGTEVDGGLGSDIEAAREASMGFSTKLKKRRLRKKKSRHHREDETEDERRQRKKEKEAKKEKSRSRSHKRSRSDESSNRSHSRAGSSRHRRRRHSEEIPEVPALPEVICTEDEAFYRPRPKTPPKTPPRTPPRQQEVRHEAECLPLPLALQITAPELSAEPLPVLLQPTVYNPNAPSPSRKVEAELSSVQLSIEADLAEAEARSSALQRAKATVLERLKRKTANKESAAVVAGLSALNLGMGGVGMQMANPSIPQNLGSCGSSVGLRLREGLFGRSMGNVSVVTDRRGLSLASEGSALVPLMFSRS